MSYAYPNKVIALFFVVMALAIISPKGLTMNGAVIFLLGAIALNLD
ncbi:MAG: hypothetical protein ACK4YL_12245 [Microcystis sp.]|nr:hypothetical protein [Microcystis sp. M49636_WE2]MCE2668477.1 hypothetical protein [Microcystis sp. 49638_E5]MCZ8058105.1 hypothetical protein [Microcystis sp. LE19-12.2C]MDJ0550025.1 hypothetical protein [Microcystis sp. M49637_WE12]MDJ0586754.1 hypothetical protein [Microcystis sp. M49636_WE2]